MPSWDARRGEPVSSQDDVEEFAALLRRLKARTDRSYAALARRLNMNASTLHRYCAGEAVPLGFAPVERFAAMCGASPAERVELHRRWILAVAARRRSRPSPGGESASPPPPGAPPEPVSSSTSPVTTEPARTTTEAPGSTSPAPSGTAAPAVSETAAPAAAGTSAPVVPVTAAGSEPTAASGPSSGPREPGAEKGLPGSRPEPEPDPAGVRPLAPRKPWHRRRFAVTAAVVTALLATLGSLSTLSSGHNGTAGTAGDDDRTAGVPNGRTAGERHGPLASSAPPSTAPGRAPGSPSPEAPAPNAGSPRPSTSPSRTAASAARPLTWTANSQLWRLGCSHDYVIRKQPGQVPPPPAPQDAAPWARTQGAVHGGETLVEISVQGRTDTAVVLEALRVRVVGRSTPVKGTVYAMDQGCGGEISPRSFAVDLDKDRPIARSVPGSEMGTNTPAMRMPYRVSAKDPEVLLVDARTVGCDCRWNLELDWSSQGRTGTEVIDDHGVPFRTSGIKGLPHYWYADRGWTPLPG
ncbi:helix-turn-helix domain-containing protein [Streptomyces sp. NBC_00728]|uniref:helix-turn-helix domain-containing protein n=1 Tax=Streptomyces sp. NBC_00728 TaxID=2903676 RepID=UPI003866A5CC